MRHIWEGFSGSLRWNILLSVPEVDTSYWARRALTLAPVLVSSRLGTQAKVAVLSSISSTELSTTLNPYADALKPHFPPPTIPACYLIAIVRSEAGQHFEFGPVREGPDTQSR